MAISIIQRMRQVFQALVRNTRAMASVELAMAMPVLMGLLLTGAEVTRYVMLNQKMERTSATVADLVSQAESLTEGDMTNLFQITSLSMDLFPFTIMGQVIVTSVSVFGGAAPIVNWQRTFGSGPGSSTVGNQGGAATLPGGVTLNDGENVIVSEVFYDYQPLLMEKIMNPANLYNYAVYRPRFGTLSGIAP
jgi:Flp pilus assembly protein TadG